MVSTSRVMIITKREYLWWVNELGNHQRALNQMWKKLTVGNWNWIKRSIPSFQITSRYAWILMLTLISTALSLFPRMRSTPWLLVLWTEKHRVLILNSCYIRRLTIRYRRWSLRSFPNCIGFIILFFHLRTSEGFFLISLATRGILEFSTFETALNAFSHHHQVRET